MSQEHLLDQVVELAGYAGWRVMHQRPARTAAGWRTPIIGDRGFPDLVLAKNTALLFLELKKPGGYPTVHQLEWLRAIGPCAACVRPEDWDWIEARIHQKSNPPVEQPSLRHDGHFWRGTLAGWAERKVPA